MIEVVCSVPHSGTRTLVEHLGIGDNSPRGRWMHFGYFGDALNIKSGRYHLHIPMRHPYDVAESHARRGKNVDALVVAYRAMLSSLTQPHTLHKMEDLSVLAGGDDSDRDAEGNRLVDSYLDRIHADVVETNRDFFLTFYEDIA